MSESPSFYELLEKARAGDREARQRLFDELARDEAEGRTILAIARKVLPSGDPARDFVESRDLIQSTLRTGWLDLSRFAGESPGQFFAWLRAILRHKLSHRLRKRQARIGGAQPADETVPDAPQDEAEPFEEALREEMVARLRGMIDALPKDMRVVVERRLAGRNAPQIAEELDLTPAAVRKRESRAMQRLRVMVEELRDGGTTEVEPPA